MITRPMALLAVALAGGAVIAGADEAKTILLDEAKYASAAAARAAWKPIDEATPPVGVHTTAAGPMLKLPCNFKTNAKWRVAWDRQGKWNLAEARRIELAIVAGRSRGARMVLHLRSGDGWYGCGFDVPPGASVMRILRKEFGVEGKPAGWGRIDGIRVSVLRGEPTDGTVLIGTIRGMVAPAGVVVYRNDAGAAEESGAPRYARLMADALDRLGLTYDLIGDKEVAAGRLAGKKVAILPLNPVLPAGAAAAMRKFVAGGGRLIVAYRLPDPLGELLGVQAAGAIDGMDGALDAIRFQGRDDRPKITAKQHSWLARRIRPKKGTKVAGRWVDRAGRVTDLPAVTRNRHGYFIAHVLTPDDAPAKDRLLMEMIGQLAPDAWREVYRGRLASLGRVAGFDGVKALVAAIEKNLRGRAAGEAKAIRDQRAQADRLVRDARSIMRYGDAVAAAEDLAKAQGLYAGAYAASVPSRPGEFRAVWCHDPAGVRGRSWDQAARALADAHFNAIIPNMCWGDAAAYRSAVLPAAPVVAEKGDQLAACLAAAAKHGLAVHVWRVNWRFGSNRPGPFREKMVRAGRVQRDPRGRALDWLCPSHPANRQLEIDAMVEIVRKYDVAGIHFDYIRYPGAQGCYCPGCRERFEKAHKVRVAHWPADVRTGPLRDKYLQFRRDNITAVVAAVAEQARRVKPKILISAAVFWHWPSARNDVGQDWKLWIEKGYLDFVCPMQYTTRAAAFEGRTKSTLAWTGGKVPLMPGIGATLGLRTDETLQQVLTARRHGTAGFVLFNYDPALAAHLRLLRLGATAGKATWTPPQKRPSLSP